MKELLFSGVGILAGTLVFLFAYSGVGKLLNRSVFYRSLKVLPFMSDFLAGIVSWAVPLCELLLAIGLLLGFRAAAIGTAGLLALFISVAAYAVRRRLSVPCNCFGGEQGRLSIGTILRNSVLLVFAFLAAIRPERGLAISELVYGAILIAETLLAHEILQSTMQIRKLQSIGGLPSSIRQEKQTL